MALPTYAGIDIALIIKQEEFFATVNAAGAIVGSEFGKPCTVDTCIQFGAIKCFMHTFIEDNLLIFSQRSKPGVVRARWY